MLSPPVELRDPGVPFHDKDAFDVGVGLTARRAVVTVRGEVDSLTGPTLTAVLDAAAEQAENEVALDLSELVFMDAAGLRAIARTIATLGATGRTLSIRSAPAMTRRILDITGLSPLVRIDRPAPEGARPEAEQSADERSLASRPADLRTDLARSRSATVQGDLVDAALRVVTTLASATVDGADGVSVTLERCGRLATVAASDGTVGRMDRHQYETGEGPCLAAAAEGHWFHIESLRDETRWPAFVPLAIDEGIASILSTPLLIADRSVGALNIYSRTAQAFGADQRDLAGRFAAEASTILAEVGTDVADDELMRRIDRALQERELIAHAEGVLMAREHLSADEAAAALHRRSRTATAPVLQVAGEVVASACTPGGPEPIGRTRA